MLGRALAVKVAQSLAISMLRCTVVSNGENPPNLSSLDVISRVFSSNFHQIHLIDVSGHCIRFTFKSCQIVAGISITSQFHDFFESHICFFLLCSPTVLRWRNPGYRWCCRRRDDGSRLHDVRAARMQL